MTRAANKLREKATLASQMDRDAAKKGVVKLSKADAKAQTRLDFKTEMYMRNVQKVKTSHTTDTRRFTAVGANIYAPTPSVVVCGTLATYSI